MNYGIEGFKENITTYGTERGVKGGPKPLEYHGNMVRRVLKGTLNWACFIRREEFTEIDFSFFSIERDRTDNFLLIIQFEMFIS